MILIVNNIWLTWKLVCMLRSYKTCNLTMRFLKYELKNKLGGVTLLKVTLGVTWTQSNQKNIRITLEIQTILQKNLQTADVVSDYW